MHEIHGRKVMESFSQISRAWEINLVLESLGNEIL